MAFGRSAEDEKGDAATAKAGRQLPLSSAAGSTRHAARLLNAAAALAARQALLALRAQLSCDISSDEAIERNWSAPSSSRRSKDKIRVLPWNDQLCLGNVAWFGGSRLLNYCQGGKITRRQGQAIRERLRQLVMRLATALLSVSLRSTCINAGRAINVMPPPSARDFDGFPSALLVQVSELYQSIGTSTQTGSPFSANRSLVPYASTLVRIHIRM